MSEEQRPMLNEVEDDSMMFLKAGRNLHNTISFSYYLLNSFE